jgi:hypothetical protein
MTETIEQAAERYADSKISTGLFRQANIKDFKAGATWQLSQPKPHRIKEWQLIHLNELYLTAKITHSRMVEILNEIAEGKHKERIEL